MDPPIGQPRMQYSQIEGIGCCGYSGFTSAMCGVYPTHTLKPSWSTIWNFTTVSMFRLFGTSLSHNCHPCMAKLPTFGSFCMGNVGKCRWIYHTWKLMCTHDVLYVLHVLSTFGEGAKKTTTLMKVVCEANGTNSNIKSHTFRAMLWDEMALSAIWSIFYPPLCEGVDTKTRLKIFRKIWSKRLETDAGKHV